MYLFIYPMFAFLVVALFTQYTTSASSNSVFLVYPSNAKNNTTKDVYGEPSRESDESEEDWKPMRLTLVDYNGKPLEYHGPSLAYNHDPGDINDWLNGVYDEAIRINRNVMGTDFDAIDINKYFLSQASPEYTCTSESSETISQARGRLVWIQMRLKSFVGGWGFNLPAFEQEGRLFAQWLVKLESVSEPSYACGTSFVREFLNAKFVFNEMADATELLKYYSLAGTPVHLILYSMVEMNVVLLSLSKSLGSPDRTTDEFSEKVKFFKTFLKQLAREYAGMRHRSLGMDVMFRKQYLKAEEALKIFF